LKHFKDVTTGQRDEEGRMNVIIMGRKTWEGIKNMGKGGKAPLPGRMIYVLSSDSPEAIGADRFKESVEVFSDLQDALESADHDDRIRDVFLIGGKGLFDSSIKYKNYCKQILQTRIGENVEGDVKIGKELFEGFHLADISKAQADNGLNYDFTRWINPSLAGRYYTEFREKIFREDNQEMEYLDLVQRVIVEGKNKTDRTGTGTRSLFGTMMRYDLGETFPLLTTKRVYWKGVVEELLWFLRGQTDSKILSSKGVTIWDKNGSKDFLEKSGFKDRREGDLGPVYGFQWRHFGAHYQTCDTDYTNQGIDQLSQVINQIKTNPDSRRHIVSAWNVSDLNKMALPPCHVLYQFYVVDGRLSCLMYQRAADMGLGVPFNIASYALLTCMVAKMTNLLPGEFVHVMGDTHVYLNHIGPLQEQLKRKPDPFPILEINYQEGKPLDQYTLADFHLVGYHPQHSIHMDMAV